MSDIYKKGYNNNNFTAPPEEAVAPKGTELAVQNKWVGKKDTFAF